jgi:predicted HicB family RNase H-like nuclease
MGTPWGCPWESGRKCRKWFKIRKKVQEEALELVAVRGQFNFRLEGKDIKRLYKLAGKQQRPVGTLVREWVLERLKKEESSKYSA